MGSHIKVPGGDLSAAVDKSGPGFREKGRPFRLFCQSSFGDNGSMKKPMESHVALIMPTYWLSMGQREGY